MTHHHSTRTGGVATVVNTSSQVVAASLALAVFGPLLAMVVYTYPLLGLGALVGLFARPAAAISRRVARQVTHYAEAHSNSHEVSATGVSLDARAE